MHIITHDPNPLISHVRRDGEWTDLEGEEEFTYVAEETEERKPFAFSYFEKCTAVLAQYQPPAPAQIDHVYIGGNDTDADIGEEDDDVRHKAGQVQKPVFWLYLATLYKKGMTYNNHPAATVKLG